MSSNYNRSEKNIARFLSKNPLLKTMIKKNYQKLSYLFSKKNYKYKSKFNLDKISLNNKESFFGYYDKSPINLTNKYIIFHSIDNYSSNKLPDINKRIDIILYNIKKQKYHKIDSSFAYNWQQGTKLQWITNSKFIYNSYINNRFISKIFNVDSMFIEKIIDYPIYDCYSDKYALSLNFAKLSKLNPDYGYRNLKYDSTIENDGIFHISFHNNKRKLLIPFKKIIDLNVKTFKDDKHIFNHIMISPNGNKFMFIHRWFKKNGQKFDSLIVSNINGTDIKVIANDDIVSHCCWFGSDKIIGYLRDINLGENFYLIDITTSKKKILSSKLTNYGDGHPSIVNGNLIFDSYPNKSRMKKLFLYNITEDTIEIIGEFFESFKFYEQTRCDLHPKWSCDGKNIFIDSVHENKRFLYKILINNY